MSYIILVKKKYVWYDLTSVCIENWKAIWQSFKYSSLLSGMFKGDFSPFIKYFFVLSLNISFLWLEK